MGLDPLASSVSGGRWGAKGSPSILYTSLAREGALAEIAYHWSQLTPLPTKSVALHRIRLIARKVVRLLPENMDILGVRVAASDETNYRRTQEIGAAAVFLGFDALIVPSARWNCENLILFTENHSLSELLEVADTEEVDWRQWARDHSLIQLPPDE